MTIAELGRNNAIGRGLVLRGTPKQIVDRLEEIHSETGANGGIILHKGIEVPGNLAISSSAWCPSCSVAGCQRPAIPAVRCVKTWLEGLQSTGMSSAAKRKRARGTVARESTIRIRDVEAPQLGNNSAEPRRL